MIQLPQQYFASPTRYVGDWTYLTLLACRLINLTHDQTLNNQRILKPFNGYSSAESTDSIGNFIVMSWYKITKVEDERLHLGETLSGFYGGMLRRKGSRTQRPTKNAKQSLTNFMQDGNNPLSQPQAKLDIPDHSFSSPYGLMLWLVGISWWHSPYEGQEKVRTWKR